MQDKIKASLLAVIVVLLAYLYAVSTPYFIRACAVIVLLVATSITFQLWLRVLKGKV